MLKLPKSTMEPNINSVIISHLNAEPMWTFKYFKKPKFQALDDYVRTFFNFITQHKISSKIINEFPIFCIQITAHKVELMYLFF